MRRHARMVLIAGALVAGGTLAWPGSASAITPVISEFKTGLQAGSIPFAITPAPDGSRPR